MRGKEAQTIPGICSNPPSILATGRAGMLCNPEGHVCLLEAVLRPNIAATVRSVKQAWSADVGRTLNAARCRVSLG